MENWMTTQILCGENFTFKIPRFLDAEKAKESWEPRVFFLCETHYNPIDRKRNVQFIKTHYSSEKGDLILVEDDQIKPVQELNLSQIEGLSEASYKIEGWDDPNSRLKREKLKAVIERINKAVNNVSDLKASDKTSDVTFLESLAAQKGFKGDGTLKNLLFKSQQYAVNLQNHMVLKYFPQRQKALEQKIKRFVENSGEGRLFILLGSKHVDVNDENVQSDVNDFFMGLKDIRFQILAAHPMEEVGCSFFRGIAALFSSFKEEGLA
jgi:hypothetical protein